MSRRKTLLIVGGSPIREGNRRLPRYDDLWTFGSVALKHPDIAEKATQIWDCHDLDLLELPQTNGIVQHVDIRHATDTDRFIRRYGKRFSSQTAWMLAFAIDNTHPNAQSLYGQICLWRVYTQLASEDYLLQALDTMYFIAIAESQGIIITVDPTSILMHDNLYGLQKTQEGG